MSRLSNNQEQFKFISEAYDNTAFIVTRFQGTEGISQLYDFEITFITKLTDISKNEYALLDDAEKGQYFCVEEMMAHPAVFVIKHNDVLQNAFDADYSDDKEEYKSDGATYPLLYAKITGAFKDTRNAFFYGYPVSCSVKSQVKQSGLDGSEVFWTFYTVRLRPLFHKLSLTTQNRIFTGKTLESIFNELISTNTFLNSSFEFDVIGSASSTVQEFSFQHNESCFNYFSAKLEHDGLYYFYSHDSKLEKLIIQDDLNKYLNTVLPNGEILSLSYEQLASGADQGDYVNSFTEIRTPTPKTLHVRDYDWKNPNTPVESSINLSDDGVGDVYYYGEGFTKDDEAKRIAKIRAEEILCQSWYYVGLSSVASLRSGHCFTLKNHHLERFNGKYLVTEIFHEGSQESSVSSALSLVLVNASDVLSYRNTFKAIQSALQFRPKRITQRPKISGVINAFVGSLSDDDRTVDPDEYGRYKIVFPQNTQLSKSESLQTTACMVRRALPKVSPRAGTGFPLYAGTEVLVSFVNGNADMPLITGAVNNPETQYTGQAALGFSDANGSEISLSDTTLRLIHNGNGLVSNAKLNSSLVSSTKTDIYSAVNTELSALSATASASYYAWYGACTDRTYLVLELMTPLLTAIGSGISSLELPSPYDDVLACLSNEIGLVFSYILTYYVKHGEHKSRNYRYGLSLGNDEETSDLTFNADINATTLATILSSSIAHIVISANTGRLGVKDVNDIKPTQEATDYEVAIAEIDAQIIALDTAIKAETNEEQKNAYIQQKDWCKTKRDKLQGDLDVYEKKAKQEKTILMGQAIVPVINEMCSELLAFILLAYSRYSQKTYPYGGIRICSEKKNVSIGAAREARLVSNSQVFIGANENLKETLTRPLYELHNLTCPAWGTECPFEEPIEDRKVRIKDNADPRVAIVSKHIFSGAQKVNRIVSLDDISINSANSIKITNKENHAILTESRGFIHYPNAPDLANLAEYPNSEISMSNTANTPILSIKAEKNNEQKNTLEMKADGSYLEFEKRPAKANLDLKDTVKLAYRNETEAFLRMNRSSIEFNTRDNTINAFKNNNQEYIRLRVGEVEMTNNGNGTTDMQAENNFNVRSNTARLEALRQTTIRGSNTSFSLENNRAVFSVDDDRIVITPAGMALL